jgi:hypothetical protein
MPTMCSRGGRRATGRALARGKDADSGRPRTVAEARTDYERDLIARGANPANARRVHTLLTPTLLAKPVSLLTARELKHVRRIDREGIQARERQPRHEGFQGSAELGRCA